MLLMNSPAAGEWTPEMRVAWWESYGLQPAAVVDETAGTPSTPMNTVSIELASR
jgi:hypothetical protein